MKKIGFLPNIDKDADLTYAKTMIAWSVQNGCTAILPKKFFELIETQPAPIPTGMMHNITCCASEAEMCALADFLVVLGGDGTILGIAKDAALYETPIMGINLGRLGYLTDVEKTDAIEALNKVLRNDYKIENRMMLTATVHFASSNTEKQATVLNEVCVSKGTSARLIETKVHVNDDYIDTYKSDGFIVSTPTGSTAYNLSAGGPILKPDIELIALTPICPHTLYSRPSVVSGDDIIKLTIEEEHVEVVVSFDGQENLNVTKGDTIIIKKSDRYTRIIKTNGLGFYDILRLKLVGIRK